MKKTGQLLKEQREAAKLSLSEVALATKINPKILTAMEEGNESALPAKTFLRGFLKSYALYLKMDPDEVLRSYQEELGPPPEPERVHEIHKPPPAQSGSSPKQERRRINDDNSSSLRAVAVIVIVVLIGVIIGIRELIEKYQREKTVESTAINVKPLEQPPVIPEPAKPTEGAAASVTPTTPTEGAPEVPPAPAPAATAEAPAPAKPAQNEAVVSPSPSPSVQTPAPKPTATAVTPAAPKVDEAKATPPAPPKPETPKKNEEVPAAAANAPTSEPASADPVAPKKTKNEIILEALDKVEVKFQIKGETKRVSLGPTQVHTIHSDQPVTLDVSDGGAVNIILNGRERGVPGDLGKPKTIKIP